MKDKKLKKHIALIEGLKVDNNETYQANNPSQNDKNQAPPIRFNKILNILIWNYNIPSNSFNLASPDYGFNVNKTSFKDLVYSVKRCFQNYFMDVFSFFFSQVLKSIEKDNDHIFCLRAFLPIQIERNKFHYCILYVLPEIQNQHITNLVFMLIPLRKYKNESISLQMLKKERDNSNSFTLYKTVPLYRSIDKLLTKEQLEIFDLYIKKRNTSSSEIAEILNKSQQSILKFNTRIKARLSDFFGINFINVQEAINYYKSCFS